MDVGLVLKLQNKVKELERDKKQLTDKIESMEEDSSRGSIISETAFDALKVSGICQRKMVFKDSNERVFQALERSFIALKPLFTMDVDQTCNTL